MSPDDVDELVKFATYLRLLSEAEAAGVYRSIAAPIIYDDLYEEKADAEE